MKNSLSSCAAFVGALAVAGVAHAQASGEPASPSLSPSVPVVEGAPPSAYVWAGAWFSNHYAGGYGGVLKALNRDSSLWDDGFVVRLDVSGGRYTYNTPGLSNVNVGTVDADVMLGYRKNTAIGNIGAYVGPSYVAHNNPDPAASIRGSKVGATFRAEYANTTNKNLEFHLQGRFSTPFSTYSADAQVLYKISGDVWLGPEVTLYGNNAPYQEISVGPFLKVNTHFGEVGVSGGYRHPVRAGNADGYFASVYFAVPIHP
jgi:hypothetical protein